MKELNNYITEKLKINKDIKIPKSSKEEKLINNIIDIFEDFIKRYIKDFDDYDFTVNFEKNHGLPPVPTLFYTFYKDYPRFAKYYNEIEDGIRKFQVNNRRIFNHIYFFSDEKTIELSLNDEIF